MLIFLLTMLLINSLIGIWLFTGMFKKRKVFDDRFGMIMAACSGGIISFSISLQLAFLLPLSFSYISLINVIIGGSIGILFGSLVKFQSLLSGYFQGFIGAIMGTMLSAVTQDPSLCNLPIYYEESILHNMYYFSVFGTTLTMLTAYLIKYSMKV
ncbi:hypothetical protein [Gracilibacillus xinjiangensis]|uniref:MnxB n=1 Tax=Gracilibacillus xinjiangensis TaxID=1193282 RepID=A0ABV8WU39_9BACI